MLLTHRSITVARDTFLEIESICFFHVSCSSIWTPRYLLFRVPWRLVSLIFRSRLPSALWLSFLWEAIFITVVFLILSESLFPISQSSRLARSEFRASFNWCKFLARNERLVSSANMATGLWFTTPVRSFMYTRNRRGPRQKPCGTPIFIGLSFESALFTLQNFFLLEI